MNILLLSLKNYQKALKTLESSIKESKLYENKREFEFFRDSTIQRFEYTFELWWKLVKFILKEIEWVECYSPKSCLKLFFKSWYIESIDVWLNMVDDKNSTSHEYWELNSEEIYLNIVNKYINLLFQLNEIATKSIGKWWNS